MSGFAIREMFFLPPLAVARVGGSDTPLDCFHWVTDPSIHAGGRTVIRPAVSFAVQSDASLSAYVPSHIRFSDNGKLRPVAPFFELWIRTWKGEEVPLTLERMAALGVNLADVRFAITIANRKAARRVQHVSCAFVARVKVHGDDHISNPLNAFSPSDPGHPPLVWPSRPISLGSFQVVRPTARSLSDAYGHKIDLSVVRVRFTPAKGNVYGPPTAVASIPSPLPEGENLAWKHDMRGRMHEIVPAAHRILNPDALWTKYTAGVSNSSLTTDPEPGDSYDGAKSGNEQSWGVVDDTCDGVLEAHMVVKSKRFSAYARVTSGPPDYAPDRRHFITAADDLADRDKPAVEANADLDLTVQELTDLLMRVFETAGQINLDAERFKFITGQAGRDGVSGDDGGIGYILPPRTDFTSMTEDDKTSGPPPYSYADLATALIRKREGREAALYAADPSPLLAFTDMARIAHAKLAQPHHLLEFLRTRADHVRRLVRPPYGHFVELSAVPSAAADGAERTFRDPRKPRDGMHDMRMPPYMRDSDDNALSLSWRQYDALMSLLDSLSPSRVGGTPPASASSSDSKQ